MRLLRLSLRNYRNYARLDIEPGSNLNVFLGRNGQGKTNLLESIAILALSSSPRARRDSELLGPVAPEARIEALVESAGRQTDMRVSYREEGGRTRRRIEVAGKPRRAVDLPGILRVALFWPDDLGLIKSGPENRRRLLNQLLVQVEAGHAADLARYARAVEQRNSLLKQIYAQDAPLDTLDAWDEELTQVGRRIVEARQLAVAQLEAAAAAHHFAIAGEALSLAYQGPPGDLLGALRQARPLDIRRGTTTIGPHRDDVLVTLGGRDARAYASQGQQRTAVVSIKLAESDVILDRTGEAPLLLLDDVLSELDPARRAALIARIGDGGQVVVTSAETGPIPPDTMRAARVRCVEAGTVVACG